MEIPCATLQQSSTSSQFHSLRRATGKIRNIFDRAYSTIMASSSRQMSSKPSLPAVVVNPFAYRRSDSNTTTSSASIPERMVKSIPFLVVCSFLLLSSTAATVRGGSSFTRSTTAQILLPWGRGVRGDNKGDDGTSTDMDMDRVVAKLARENQKLEQEMRDLQEALLQASHQFRVVSAETERLHVAALEFTVWEDSQLRIDLEQLVTVSSDWTLDTQ